MQHCPETLKGTDLMTCCCSKVMQHNTSASAAEVSVVVDGCTIHAAALVQQ